MLNNDKTIFETYESEIRAYCRAVPTVFKSSSNATMIDEDDKEFIDFFGGAGVLNFGHNNPKMKEELIEFIQRDGVAHSLDMFTDVKRDFIKTFVDTVLKPRGWEDRKLQFTGPTGTNAVEAALKLARKITGRTEVVAFNRGFHGMTLAALACTANNAFRSSSGVPLNHVIRDTFNDMDALENLRQKMFDLASGMLPPAAFIVEPVQAEGGVRIATKEWLQGVQQLAKDTGALFILDSIQCGCGRCGSYFSFDDLDVDPDIIILAKGLGGFGTPIAMLVNKPEVDKAWSPGQHTGTFRGQGFSFVAGKIGLEYFKNEQFNEETKRKGDIVRKVLDKLNSKYEKVVDVRQKGLMLAIEFDSAATVKEITAKTYENGLIIGACSTGEIIKFIPPLTITDEELNKGLERFTASVEAILS
ncbi:4-aminobutyrate aminotransferase [Malaciobacter marinus]|uniref:4-aminobutyrate aminotransferase n=1 Tax=Malaciobacter marinus TaxID=505249 RepID=A0A347TLB9_9BACT|nr:MULTISPECIES: diaminobutyrate--2-oxoglutarate transaminase [Malaciobacter]AXX87397.1 4-aminobutyrate aminotransferase [Malaciobacter marinus]PHO13658.1 diaminobutyrate--2-oxoglutarate transaminase [Malaciobacter marinus]PHO16260.1 diaminobutyrate--2-oxoglutarate transaminase [Malaciobacter marinus]RYA23958.1 diaminobutyrate--2-oxoglutarate transaminase [Malaciobacter halophilus]